MLIEACRTDIGDQIIQFKTEQRKKSDNCHVCNISIIPGESETAHYPTSFSDILNIFLSTKALIEAFVTSCFTKMVFSHSPSIP